MRALNERSNHLNYCSDLIEEQINQTPDCCGPDSGWARGVADRYRDRALVFVTHLQGRRFNGERANVGAVLNFGGEISERLEHVPSRALDLDLGIVGPRPRDCQQSVFIGVVEIPQKAEERRERAMLSIVRLYPLDSCPHCLAQRRYSGLLASKLGGSIGDGKLQYPLLGGWIGFSLINGDSIHKMVESRPQVMDNIAKEQRPSVPVGNGT